MSSGSDSGSATMTEFIVRLCSPTLRRGSWSMERRFMVHLASRQFRHIFYHHIIAIHFFPPLFSPLFLPAIFISTVDHRNRQAGSVDRRLSNTNSRLSEHQGTEAIRR